MGIRFYCPNGHKLNVKEFQAGRRGICPYCGAKIQIPTHSTRHSAREEAAGRAAAGPTSEQTLATQPAVGGAPPPAMPAYAPAEPQVMGGTWPSASPTAASQPYGSPTAPETAGPLPAGGYPQPAGFASSPAPLGAPNLYERAPAATGPPSAATTAFQSAPTAVGDFASAPGGFGPSPAAPAAAEPAAAPPPPSAAAPDPLAEAGDAVWYVRPSSGGQYGPANAEVMRGWLAEGRVPADALVWREGWRDWQSASEVFPQFRKEPGPLGNLGIGPGPTGGAAASALGQRGAARRQSRNLQVAIVVMLVLAVIVLAIVFALVLVGDKTESHHDRRPTPLRVTAQVAVAAPADVFIARVADRPFV